MIKTFFIFILFEQFLQTFFPLSSGGGASPNLNPNSLYPSVNLFSLFFNLSSFLCVPLSILLYLFATAILIHIIHSTHFLLICKYYAINAPFNRYIRILPAFNRYLTCGLVTGFKSDLVLIAEMSSFSSQLDSHLVYLHFLLFSEHENIFIPMVWFSFLCNLLIFKDANMMELIIKRLL